MLQLVFVPDVLHLPVAVVFLGGESNFSSFLTIYIHLRFDVLGVADLMRRMGIFASKGASASSRPADWHIVARICFEELTRAFLDHRQVGWIVPAPIVDAVQLALFVSVLRRIVPFAHLFITKY